MAEYANADEVLARVQETVPFFDRPIRSIDERGLFGDTSLILVMTWEDAEAAARRLLEAGASVNLRGEDGETALHRAVWSQNVELIRLLLDAGASPNIKNDEGQTPLDEALLEGNSEIIGLLADAHRRLKEEALHRRSQFHLAPKEDYRK